jgi:hypothetical protein
MSNHRRQIEIERHLRKVHYLSVRKRTTKGRRAARPARGISERRKAKAARREAGATSAREDRVAFPPARDGIAQLHSGTDATGGSSGGGGA